MQKGVDAIGYALYNAAAIFINHSGRDIAHATYR
ncbi:inosine-5-monophosphate dehydrogenase [Escherichia coli B921]|nr:inosine-5-monophosphate dehydrogenase [Escherichia coli B921]